ncbi:TIGR00730 family Rossman fold protein [Actinomadura sp. LD22]|uniref:TIGR00730 family Rossman fold protein n=1 Tax=Actinomadura physcomitrii TaxID=2650748 RepID=A0A6I4MQY8_9ACTN|nr:LOG family protein [Actinomadura physcomitrii]MWA07430.1 TIGR00730 family Rossman fold protein [Actinomadura physcomitrii]
MDGGYRNTSSNTATAGIDMQITQRPPGGHGLTALPRRPAVERTPGRLMLAETAYAVGRGLADRGIEFVCVGGGSGLMRPVSQGVSTVAAGSTASSRASWCSRSAGGSAVSQTWRRLSCTTMHERKALMAEPAQAFLTLPDGLCMLEELFDVWTWQTLALNGKPIGLLNIDGFWEQLVTLRRDIADIGFLEHVTID